MSQQKIMYDLSVSLHKLSRLVEDHLHELMESEGITDIHPSAGIILIPLLGREGQTLSELARLIHMKAPTITVIANRLEEKGWIRRERGTKDRRQVHLYLTKNGRQKAEVLDGIHRKVFQRMSQGIDRSSLVQANNTLAHVIINMHGRAG